MLKVELTENYAGVTIYGDYNDLDFLYDSINYLIHGDPTSDREYTMQNHLYGFLYDVRHAYQGQREAILIDNNLNDNTREWFKFKKKDITDKNICFCFNYLLPDLFLDMVFTQLCLSIISYELNRNYLINEYYARYLVYFQGH